MSRTAWSYIYRRWRLVGNTMGGGLKVGWGLIRYRWDEECKPRKNVGGEWVIEGAEGIVG